jgi:precorrin-4 methylase
MPVVLIIIAAATFEDETVWRVPLPDAQDRVKAEAARLIGMAGVEGSALQ